MKSTPILMSAPMVRATLNGTKRQTRRIYKPRYPAPYEGIEDGNVWRTDEAGDYYDYSQYGKAGDELWVRETWAVPHEFDAFAPREIPPTARVSFAADANLGGSVGLGGLRTRVSIFMPRALSRITLRITDVRVERLQEISEEDAIAEGIERINRDDRWWRCYAHGGRCGCLMDPATSYASLWRSINGPDSWELNPWAWVIEFERIKP